MPILTRCQNSRPSCLSLMMSKRSESRILDCSATYLIPSKTTKITKRKIKTIAQVREDVVVQIISSPMDVMATVTWIWIRKQWARTDHPNVFLPLMTKVMLLQKLLRSEVVTRPLWRQIASQKVLWVMIVSILKLLKAKSINCNNVKSRNSSVTTPRHSTE